MSSMELDLFFTTSPGREKKTTKVSAACCLYFFHLIVPAISEEVTGLVNDTLILPCTYSVQENPYPMCWGRGDCSYSGCNDEIIRTDGRKVTGRKSDRYRLLGNISQGDVSMTITGATKEDGGTYCCRVEVTGPFNDQKIKVELKIQEVLAGSEEVTGLVNNTLVLPCTYPVYKYHNPVCWGRGDCPYSGCNDEIIRTDGEKVTWRKSDRYRLLGNISQGDVSMTITGATKEDEGTYCCRVEISGAFNDLKNNVYVKIQEPEESTEAGTSVTYTTPVASAAYRDLDSPVTITIPRSSFTSQETTTEQQSSTDDSTFYAIAGVAGVLFLIALAGVTIYICKHRKGNTTKTESTMSVVNMEALAGTGNEATENIYT